MNTTIQHFEHNYIQQHNNKNIANVCKFANCKLANATTTIIDYTKQWYKWLQQ